MPKIQRSNLPPELRDHLFKRARERKISIEDLFKLKLWREAGPDAPDGLSYKDFGSFQKFAARVNVPRLFSSAAGPPKGRNLNRLPAGDRILLSSA